MEKHHFCHAQHHRLSRYGIEDCLQSRRPKLNAYSTPLTPGKVGRERLADPFPHCTGTSFLPPTRKSSIVRVHYFVRGGFGGHCSRASSKHISPHLPVDGLASSGVKKGLRCSCKMHVWVSGPQRSRPDVDVLEKRRYRVLKVETTLSNCRKICACYWG
ncbi:hypothetical protein TNCV_1249801 [Trichonephila clavipes]|nr:hypothetical protein TNCV_1249801 [Trichonephila clavipes]